MDFDCLGFGICAADYLCIVPGYPKLDEKTEAVQFSYQGGGPVATAMVTLTRLGFSATYVGKIGNDSDGEFVLSQFEKEGVDTSGIIVDKEMPTNNAFIWIDQISGKKSIVLNGNQYRPVQPEEILISHINSVKYVLIDGRDTSGTFKIINWAKEQGARVVLDAGSPRNEMESLLTVVDYPIVSFSFCQKYFQSADMRKIIDKLLGYGASAAVVTCGEDGCYGGDETGFYFQNAFKVNVVDTTGAGDVFHGAFIAGLLKNLSLPENLRFASAVAAMKCTQLGGRQGIPTLNQVDHYLENLELTKHQLKERKNEMV